MRKCPIGYRRVQQKCVRVRGTVGNVPASALVVAASVPMGVPMVPFMGLGATSKTPIKPHEVRLIARVQGQMGLAMVQVGSQRALPGGSVMPGETGSKAIIRLAELGGWRLEGTLKLVSVQREDSAGLKATLAWYALDGVAVPVEAVEGITPVVGTVEEMWKMGEGNESADVIGAADNLIRTAIEEQAREAARRGETRLPYIPPPALRPVNPAKQYVIPELESSREWESSSPAVYEAVTSARDVGASRVTGREARDILLTAEQAAEPMETYSGNVYTMTPEALVERRLQQQLYVPTRTFSKGQVEEERRRTEAAARSALEEEERLKTLKKTSRAAAKRQLTAQSKREEKSATRKAAGPPASGKLVDYADSLIFPVGPTRGSGGRAYGYDPKQSNTELTFLVEEDDVTLMPLKMEVGKATFNRFKVDPARRLAFYVREGAQPVVSLRGLDAIDLSKVVAVRKGDKPLVPVMKRAALPIPVAAPAPVEPAPAPPVVTQQGVIEAPRALVREAYGERTRGGFTRVMSEANLAPFLVSEEVGTNTVTRFYRAGSKQTYPAKFPGDSRVGLVEFRRSHESMVDVQGVPTPVIVYTAMRPGVVEAPVRVPAREVTPSARTYETFPLPSEDEQKTNRDTIINFLTDTDVNDAGTFVPDLRATWTKEATNVSSFRVDPKVVASGGVRLSMRGVPDATPFGTGNPVLVFRHFRFKREVRFEGRLINGMAVKGFTTTAALRGLNVNRPALPVTWMREGTNAEQEGLILLDYATARAMKAWMGKLANAQLGKLNGWGVFDGPECFRLFHGSPAGGLDLTAYGKPLFFTPDAYVAAQYARRSVVGTGQVQGNQPTLYSVEVCPTRILDTRKADHLELANARLGETLDPEWGTLMPTGFPAYSFRLRLLKALPEFDAFYIDEGTQGWSVMVRPGAKNFTVVGMQAL